MKKINIPIQEPLKTVDNEPKTFEEATKTLDKDKFVDEPKEMLKEINSSSKEPKTVEK